jgi:hypothetical protein
MSEMPWALLKFDGSKLHPASSLDLKLIADRYPMGTDLRGKFAKPRSLVHHRLYWAVLSEIVDATDSWLSIEDLHESIKLHLRMVREVHMINGGVRFVTRSISFDAMDQGEYRLFFKRAMLAIEGGDRHQHRRGDRDDQSTGEPTMTRKTEKLQAAGQILAIHLDEILTMFKPGSRAILVIDAGGPTKSIAIGDLPHDDAITILADLKNAPDFDYTGVAA